MQTPKEHRQHAAECLELARAANEFYVKSALIELAAEFNKLAEQLERTERRRATSIKRPIRPVASMIRS